jgi:UDP-glucose 4-epimerase
MTRFLLSLEDAVDSIVEALRSALPGETYIPMAPGTRVVHIARALIGERRIAIKSTGVRPGEKFDEILVSEEEINHTIRRGKHYVIRPMLPELQNGEDRLPRALTKEFSSGDHVLDYEGTVALLRRHRLMPEDADSARASELLR